MKIRDYISKYGERKTAIKLVSDRIYIHCGMSTSELPDTEELCSMYDKIEELLKTQSIENSKKIVEILDSIDYEFVEQIMYS
jgi:hypothetical protein